MIDKETILLELADEIRTCPKCRLAETRTHAVPGEGSSRARLMFVGEGPGENEDQTGRPFVGQAGQFLNGLLEKAGIAREDVFITNTVKCFISPRVLIYTSEGYKPIKDIRVGDLVLTHKGHFRPVVYVRPNEILPQGSPVVRLTIRALGDAKARPVHLTVTPEHPFLIDGEWKAASAIQVGERAQALGDRCEVCGRVHFVRHDRYEKRTFKTCSCRCHNKRIYHDPQAREKVRQTMREQYADLRRDRHAITAQANNRVRALVALGEARLQNLSPEERRRSRVAVASNVSVVNGLSRQRRGYGEEEMTPIFKRLEVDFVHQWAFPDSSFIYDFCLPEHKILIEVRGPGTSSHAAWQTRAIEKDALAEKNGHLVLNLWWGQIVEHPGMVEAMLARILKNHAGQYDFVEVEVTQVEHRQTRRNFPLYNIGVEGDESYVAAGIVSHNCRPPGNRVPQDDEVEACSDYLMAQIAVIEPVFVVPLGGSALKTLLGANMKITQARCRVFRKSGILYIPLYHPAAALHNSKLVETLQADVLTLKELINRPLRPDEITDLSSLVQPEPDMSTHAAPKTAKPKKDPPEETLSLF